jgi:hypothetical protein
MTPSNFEVMLRQTLNHCVQDSVIIILFDEDFKHGDGAKV